MADLVPYAGGYPSTGHWKRLAKETAEERLAASAPRWHDAGYDAAALAEWSWRRARLAEAVDADGAEATSRRAGPPRP